MGKGKIMGKAAEVKIEVTHAEKEGDDKVDENRIQKIVRHPDRITLIAPLADAKQEAKKHLHIEHSSPKKRAGDKVAGLKNLATKMM